MILLKTCAGKRALSLIGRMRTSMAVRLAMSAALAILSLAVVACSGCPPTPSVASISPSTATAGAAGFSLTVSGGNFSSNAVVVWNGSPQTTTFVSSHQLNAAISSTQIADPDTALVYVYNPTGETETVGASGVTATNPQNGCSAQGSNEVSFTVNP